MSISELKTGQSATVEKIDENSKHFHRLLSLGFIPGDKLTIISKAPFGGPISLKLENQICIALRKSEADLIAVIP